MAGPSDYHRGEMDIHAQQSTYKLFMGLSKWGALYTAALILFLSLWLCAHAGFLRSALATIVMIVLGTLFLADKKKSH
jgi:hypothetical protein